MGFRIFRSTIKKKLQNWLLWSTIYIQFSTLWIIFTKRSEHFHCLYKILFIIFLIHIILKLIVFFAPFRIYYLLWRILLWGPHKSQKNKIKTKTIEQIVLLGKWRFSAITHVYSIILVCATYKHFRNTYSSTNYF